MRILHVITSLRIGGAEQLVADISSGLCRRGHHVEVLLFDGTRTHLHERLEECGIPVHALGHGALQMRNPLHVFRLRGYLDKSRFDLVHTHNTACQLLVALAAPADGPILVTTEHNTFNRRRNWRWYDPADRWMYSRYSHVICVGAETERNLAAKLSAGGRMPAMSVIPNGVNLARFAEVVPDDTLRTAEERDKHIIIMVSAFRPQKDQPTLIRAMRSLSDDYRLWLVGDWTLRASCERLAEESGVGERVRFWGFREDVPALVAASDVVVLSSHYEGMSLASIEGMASGKPFIASDVEGLHDVVEGAGLLFPQGDSERLAELVREVCEDEGLRNEVVSRCRRRASQYDIENVISAYERIYTELVKQTKN